MDEFFKKFGKVIEEYDKKMSDNAVSYTHLDVYKRQTIHFGLL